MECLRDCGWGSVEDLASLDTKGRGASVTSAATREGASGGEASMFGFGGRSAIPGDDASGLAIRKPPND
jgi:hypothetical protein